MKSIKGESSRKKRRSVAVGLVGLAVFAVFWATAGCGKFSLIPVTLKEVKDLVLGRQKSFSFPLSRVLPATVSSLRDASFDLRRIESFQESGLVEARWDNTLVVVELDSITPSATKATSRISRDAVMREYSLEDTIFENIDKALRSNERIVLAEFVKNMTKVHSDPDPASPVVAYLGAGADVRVVSETAGWAEIALEKGFRGYMDASRVR